MNRSFTQASARTLCLGLAALAALSWSCTKEPSFDGDTGQQAEGAIAQARSYYESTAPSLTKTVADQTVAIKPLPGDMTPLWDKAAATVLSDGTTAWVDVPIEGTITYTAIRGGHHHHEAGEDCGHNHDAVQAVQKLTVYTAADGTQQSLIATIVPEPDCTAVLNDFSSANGLAGFSGFVSWHDLTGKLVRVASYENGTKTKSIEATGDNEAEILEVVDETILYPEETDSYLLSPATKALPSEYCKYCKDKKCKAKNIWEKHCPFCGQYQLKDFPFDSNCKCRRCGSCGDKLAVGTENCPKCGKKVEMPKFCSVCNMYLCAHLIGCGYDPGISYVPPRTEQEDMLEVLRHAKTLTQEQFEEIKKGCFGIDINYQNQDYMYMHGLYLTGSDDDQRRAHQLMRNHFINWALEYIFNDSYYCLGKALHPIADTYVPVQTRINMLSFYSYGTIWNIVDGRFVTPYTSDLGPGTQALTYLCNALKGVADPTPNAIGAIFDRWLQMTGGGY